MKKVDVINDKPGYVIVNLSLPVLVTNIFTNIQEIIDAIFIGKLGSHALAGVSMGGVVIFFLATFGTGISIGTISLISHYTGAKDYKKTNMVAFQALIMGFIFSIFLTFAGLFLSDSILKLLGAKDKVFTTGHIYLRTLFSGIITLFLMFWGNSVLRGSGDTITPMRITVIVTGINIFLNWVLIFGKLGMPAMGVKGAALATIIARGAGGIIFFYLLVQGRKNIHINFKRLYIDFKIMKNIINIGFPASIQMVLRSLSTIILIKIASHFGTHVIAVYGIGSRIFSLFMLPGFALGLSTVITVGQNLGAQKYKRAKEFALISARYYFIILSCLACILFIFPETVVKIFNTEPLVVKTGKVYMRFLAISALFLSAGLIFSRVFFAMKKAFIPMIVTFITLIFVQFPLAYFLSFKAGLKELGLWISYPVSNMIFALLITILFFKETKKWDSPSSSPQ